LEKSLAKTQTGIEIPASQTLSFLEKSLAKTQTGIEIPASQTFNFLPSFFLKSSFCRAFF